MPETASSQPRRANKREQAVTSPGLSESEHRRFHQLLDQQMAGALTPSRELELEQLARKQNAQPPPPEFAEAMASLARDRHSLAESMARIETLLAKTANTGKADSARSKTRKQVTTAKLVENTLYHLADAVTAIQNIKFGKMDDTLEMHMQLGMESKRAAKAIRGSVILPNGFGKTAKVLVIASGDKIQEALDAGADFAGGEELVTRILTEAWLDFDVVVATPDMMRSVGKLGKLLGPRGLMPEPKTGTVTNDVRAAVKQIKASKIEFHIDKTGVVHAPIGKVSLKHTKLVENAASLIGAVLKAKPTGLKTFRNPSATVVSVPTTSKTKRDTQGIPVDLSPFLVAANLRKQ